MRSLLSWTFVPAFMLVGLAGCPATNVGVNNSPPEASIIVPEEGFSAPEGTEFSFSGQVNDRLTALTDLAVSWSSSLDGQLFEGMADADGNTAFDYGELSTGDHTITLRVVDPDGASGSDTVSITVFYRQESP